jgi:sugar transferase (PEP-CTERM/EpsH1 system associated)
LKIAWLKTELLHPIDKGGKIRTYETLKYLKDHHRITYISFRRPDEGQASLDLAGAYADSLITVPLASAERYTAAFYAELTRNLASPLPYAIQKYRSDEMRRAIEQALSEEDFDLLVCDFLTPCVNLPEGIAVPSILFQHNVESQIWERYYQTASNPMKKAYLYSQFRKMARFEGRCLHRFDGIVAVSDSDRRVMSSRFGVDNIYSVRTGVDTHYFMPDRRGFRNRYELIFTGSMDYLPNEDAILYFADAILPRIVAAIGEVSLTVVGRNPTPRLLALSRSDPRIQVTGSVPEVRSYLERAACFVVPIRIGGGTRLKIFEAMSMAKPVVSTSVGAEGLPVSDGADVLIADDPLEFADRVIQVLTDTESANRMARRARELVTRNFTWESAAGEFSRVCLDVANRQRKPKAA